MKRNKKTTVIYPPSPINERESNGVKYWETWNDANHNNRHAAALDIEFFAFPYQGYISAHVGSNGQWGAHVSRNLWPSAWFATVHKATGGGKTEAIAHQRFETSDQAFMWAAEELRRLEQEEKQDANG